METPERAAKLLRLIAVDNIDTILDGLGTLPESHPDLVASLEKYADVDDIDLTGPAPDVVILDFWLGRDDRSSLGHVAALHEWGARVVLYTSEEKPYLLRLAMTSDVDGLCLKSDGKEALLRVVSEVAQGQRQLSSPWAVSLVDDQRLMVQLTDAEHEVLTMIGYGMTHRQIADHRNVELSTIKTQVDSIRTKYADGAPRTPNGPGLTRRAMLEGRGDPRLGGPM